MNKLYKAYRTRLMVLCMTILTAIIVIIHTTVYFTAKGDIESQIEINAIGIAVSISQTLMMNIDEYKLFLETREEHSEYYTRFQEYFREIKTNGNIKYIYTEKKYDATRIEFILDSEPIGCADHSPPGAIQDTDQHREEAYSSEMPTGFKLVEYSRWGKLLGAYAPIFDKDGELLGLVGVNIDASQLFQHLNSLNVTLVAIYIFIMGLSYLSITKYSHKILEPLLTDKLTGALSKRYFEANIQNEIKQCVKNHQNLALMMLDLDHFKNINDTYGHAFGDIVLSATSDIIRKSLRPADCFIRYGGEEFVIIIVSTDIKHVLEVAERIRKSVEENPIVNKEYNTIINITISIGVANFTNLNLNAKDMIENADKALYKAKTKRNMVSLYDGTTVN